MAIDNNVNLQQLSNQSQKNDILTKPQKYQVNPNAVDKTPDKDTVQLSSGLTTKEKVGIGAAIATGITLITFAVLGRNGHLGEGIQKFLGGKAKKAAQEMGEHTHTTNTHVEPKPTVKPESEPTVKPEPEQTVKPEPEQEAKAKAEQEAKAKAEQEAKAKAEQEAKAKAEQEAKAKAEREARRKAEREAEVKARRLGFNYADENMEELDKLFLDKNGNLVGVSDSGTEKCNFKDLVKPYNEELGTIYHGTTPEAKEKILTEGFRQDVAIAHGDLDGMGGTYFALDLKNGQDYGAVIKAKFNGKVAKVDTERVEYILKHDLLRKVMRSNIATGTSYEEKLNMRRAIVLRYLQNKLKQMGYQGLVNNYSCAAACQYFSALEPSLIQIIK